MPSRRTLVALYIQFGERLARGEYATSRHLEEFLIYRRGFGLNAGHTDSVLHRRAQIRSLFGERTQRIKIGILQNDLPAVGIGHPAQRARVGSRLMKGILRSCDQYPWSERQRRA